MVFEDLNNMNLKDLYKRADKLSEMIKDKEERTENHPYKSNDIYCLEVLYVNLRKTKEQIRFKMAEKFKEQMKLKRGNKNDNKNLQ